ncbi:MAG: EAL domain-containing protein [Tardiphaga sp.]|nr:EAL domain-containing protein [Tardiphaga sp.]
MSGLLRQAVLDANGAVHGYEMIDRSPGGNAVEHVLAQRETLQLADRRNLFVRASPRLIESALQDCGRPQLLVLQIPTPADDDPALIATLRDSMKALRERGVLLSLDRAAIRRPYADWWPLASYVKLDLATKEALLLEPVNRFVRAHMDAKSIACNVDTKERFEQLRDLGFPYFQGDWFARPSRVATSTIRPSQAVVIQLINLLRSDAEFEALEPLLKSDPSLSFNLLRAINASSMGLSCEVTSLRHAVMIFGRKRLFRWASMLLSMSREGGAPAIATTAMVRGRLMELFAAELLPPQECDNAFVTGVFSLLDAMLGMPMADALSSLALPESVGAALLRREGVFAPFLALTEACESADEARFADICEHLQLSSHQVNFAHLQALAWAEELAQGW